MHTYYALGGISKLPTTPDRLNGWTEVFFYNPTPEACRARITGYFENRDPIDFDKEVIVKPYDSGLFMMPDTGDFAFYPEIFADVGFWGLKFETSTTLDIVIIQVIGPREKMGEQTTYKGGVSHFLANGLSKQWHFADGLWLNWTAALKGDIARAPFPFNELEYYFFLNPSSELAKVDMTLQFRKLEPMTVHLKVPAGRVYAWCNFEKIPYNQAYGVKVVSDQPIATTSVRYIYSLKGFEDWGINLHCGMPPQAGPIME